MINLILVKVMDDLLKHLRIGDLIYITEQDHILWGSIRKPSFQRIFLKFISFMSGHIYR